MQAAFGRTCEPKIRHIVPLDGCACMITSWMLNALWYLSHETVHFHSSEYTEIYNVKGVVDLINSNTHMRITLVSSVHS